MDKVQQVYWDEYVAPLLNTFYDELDPHVRPLLVPEDFPPHKSPEDLQELITLLEKHLAIFKAVFEKSTELSDARLRVKIAVEAARPE